eukprot:CAMPEP_0182446574 /NCGR_PEP_ID=MMETSP1172-20130603/4290_1 /TAXON_ID=708627 /ORGANISM="Timspurckia oligopyrenoides, Strain CCMP3278" /LENGTH=328 /DNA_ID=CAMNT_0024642525 /DNA_START=84 /DNA_END=1070 /DNA_ORIENTATION=-
MKYARIEEVVPSMEDFHVEAQLHCGLYSRVLRAVHVRSGSPVVLKELNKQQLIRNEKLQMALQERSIHERLHHPSIVQLRSAFHNQQFLYFVLELCESGSLYSLFVCNPTYITSNQVDLELPQQQPLKIHATLIQSIINQTLQAIKYLHLQNIIHCDVKPENILCSYRTSSEICVKLADFGSCIDLKAFQSPKKIKQKHLPETTAGYTPPEFLKDEPKVTTAVDIWGLGCTLYFCVTGHHLFVDSSTLKTYNAIENFNSKVDPCLSSENLMLLSIQSRRSFGDDALVFCEAVSDLLRKVLVRNPEDRLGFGESDFASLEAHPFFSSSY